MLAIVPSVTAVAATGLTTLRAPLLGMARDVTRRRRRTGCSGTRTVTWPGSSPPKAMARM